MRFASTPLDGFTVTILASDDYQAVPLKIDETDLVKAGMPITGAGKKATDGTDAIGILLYDVDPKANPNGAVVVDGIIDWKKCQTHNSSDLDGTDAAAISKKLPNIVFRDDTGKTYAGTGASE